MATGLQLVRKREAAAFPGGGVRLELLSAILTGAILSGSPVQWLDVPFVRQTRDGCGAASIAMVMQYWIRSDPRLDPGVADENRIYGSLSMPGRRGIAGRQLRQYLEENGYDARVIRGEPGDLREHLAKGRPLVVCLAPRRANALLHYVVVVGISSSTVLFHDPVRGKLSGESFAPFLRQWAGAQNWLLVATPHRP